jgi:hypothetical protein
VYPENKPEDFKISLREPLDFDVEDEWEVGLLDFHYPVSWVNIGGRADTKMFFYAGGAVEELHMPEWHCQDMAELVRYMQGEVPKGYQVSQDGLGRFVIESEGWFCEVGMTDQMMSILGFDGLPESVRNGLSVDSLRKRAVWKEGMMRFWKGRDPLDFEFGLVEKIVEAKGDFVSVARLLRPHVAVEKLPRSRQNSSAWLIGEEGTAILANINEIAVALGLENGSTETAVNFAFLYHQVISFCEADKPPKKIVASSKDGLSKNFDQLFIHVNIIEPLDLNDGVSDVLRVVKSRGERGRTIQEVYSRPVFHPVKKGGKISLIHVSVRGTNGELVPFTGGVVLMTLQFRRRR